MSWREALDVFVEAPLREAACVARVPRLWRVSCELATRYALRFPAVFVWRDRRALGAVDPEDDSFLFGETPFHTAQRICQRLALRHDDFFLDLGCGRGKMVFFAHLATGCRAMGVDALETYVRVAEEMRRGMGLSGVRFLRQDLRETDLNAATALFVHGPTFSNALWTALEERLNALGDGTRVAVVGRTCEGPRLRLVGQGRYTFSWGWSVVRYYEAGPSSDTGGKRATEGLRRGHS